MSRAICKAVRPQYGVLGVWSADYMQITGQALVTRRVVEHVAWDSGRPREYIYSVGGAGMVVTWLAASARLWVDLALRRISTLYVVCSRSDGGFLRDLRHSSQHWLVPVLSSTLTVPTLSTSLANAGCLHSLGDSMRAVNW